MCRFGRDCSCNKNALPNDALVTAVELSEHAEPWARINCETYGVNFVHGDALSALEGLGGYFDAVVSNPPYIPQGRVPAEPEAAQHDPDIALYGGQRMGCGYRLRLLPGPHTL